MPVTPSYAEFVSEQLAALGDVVRKRMFGGVGFWFAGTMFGLIDDDTVYLRVDDETRPEFVKREMSAFRPVKDKVSENYYELPSDVLEDAEECVAWARRAIRAAGSPSAAVAKRVRAQAAKTRAAKAAKGGKAPAAERGKAKPGHATKKPKLKRSAPRR